MFTDAHRLRSPNAVRRPSRYGKGAKSKHMGIKYIESNIQGPRIAVVVSKKVSKSAVKRNRIKRRIIENIRQNFITKLNQNLDIVIFAYSSDIAKLPSVDLTLELNDVFQKANILQS